MQSMIQQWGNSLALRIPKGFAQQMKVKKGSAVDFSVENGRMVVKPLRRQKYTIEELVSKITPKNRPSEIEWGKPIGKEIW